MTQLQLLAWSECPSHDSAKALVRDLLAELGHPELPIDVTWVETEEAARELKFTGSPTFRWEGEELIAADESWYGLACRLYRRRDGRASPLPDPDDLRQALQERLS